VRGLAGCELLDPGKDANGVLRSVLVELRVSGCVFRLKGSLFSSVDVKLAVAGGVAGYGGSALKWVETG
jgi:hypothetical protein